MDKPFFIDPNIARAKTIDTSFYLETKWLEASKEKIFAPSWQYIGHTGMVPKPGDAYPFKLLENYIDEPLVLTRDAEEHIHCLSNVCTHRGNLMVYEPCTAQKHLRCKYHGRAFHLDGKFISMPEFKDVQNFIPENLRILLLLEILQIIQTHPLRQEFLPSRFNPLKIDWLISFFKNLLLLIEIIKLLFTSLEYY